MCGYGCGCVILNKVKNLVISVIASALTLSDPSTALRYAQDDKHSLRSWVGFYLPASCGVRWRGCGGQDCHGQSPRNDVAGILLYTRTMEGRGERRHGRACVCAGILLYTRVGRDERCAVVGVRGSF